MGQKLLGGVLLVGAMLVSAGPAAAAIPVPAQDPFYAVPADISSFANGAVLKSREIQASTFGLPLRVTAWQVQYKSLDSTSRPTADVATILIPIAAWTGAGSRPLVSYQTAQDGVSGKCSPSYSLRGGPTAGNETETPLIALALARGLAVVAPDYEGPNNAFFGAPGQAHGVLDGIRAAMRFGPDGFTAKTPLALWGYSGGSIASTQAALFQPTYAPEIKFDAIALGGLVAELEPTIKDFEHLGLGAGITMGLIGMQRAYPDSNIAQYLNAYGKSAVAATQDDCVLDAVQKYPAMTHTAIEAYPDAFYAPGLQGLFHDNSPEGIAGTPTAPIYDYHAVLDELAPVANDRSMMHRLCDAGATVQHVEDLVAEHQTDADFYALRAIDFLAGRFAGKPAVNTCATIPAAPVAPAPVTIPVAPATSPACGTGRRVTLHIRELRDVRVTVDGRRVAVHRHGRTTQATIDLSGYPRRVVTIRVTGVTKHHKRVAQIHRYHPCASLTSSRDVNPGSWSGHD
jgi:hypothetical protein